MRWPYVTTVRIPRQQPIPYSHKLHVGQPPYKDRITDEEIKQIILYIRSLK